VVPANEQKEGVKMKFSIKEVKLVVIASTMVSVGAVGILSNGSSSLAGTPAADAAATYKTKCASCHAADGSGSTAAGKAMKLRDLRSAEVQKQSDDQLYAVIANGKGKMPGYAKTLGADTCKELVAHIRKLGGK
jgi:cytochrome c553